MIDVSVLITCYNKEKYLNDCVTSVLRQTKPPKEIIIVHDQCSEPMHHAEATTIMLKANLGVCRARQEAFRFSTGKHILFLDGDDMISPDYLEKMRLAVANDKAISYPDIYFFGDAAPSLSTTPDKLEPKTVQELNKIPIPVTSLMSREIYEELGGFKDFPVLEDFDFWLRAMAKGYEFRKAQTLFWYRQEGMKRNAIDVAKKKRIIAEIMAQFTITDNIIKKND